MNSIQKLTHKLLHSFTKSTQFSFTQITTYGEYIIDLFLSPLQSTLLLLLLFFLFLNFLENTIFFYWFLAFSKWKFFPLFNYEKNVFIDLKILFCFTLNVNKKHKKTKKLCETIISTAINLLVTFYEIIYIPQFLYIFVNKSVT